MVPPPASPGDPPEDPIHEHCCFGEQINFRRCDINVVVPGMGSVNFCRRFLGEESFKNNVDKRGWVLSRWSTNCQVLPALRVKNVIVLVGRPKGTYGVGWDLSQPVFEGKYHYC